MEKNLNQFNKAVVWSFWEDLENCPPERLMSCMEKYLSHNFQWLGFDPLGQLRGLEQFVHTFWLPLKKAFPDLSRETHIFMGGRSNGRIDGNLGLDGKMWVSGTGYFNATFANDYLSIPATGKRVRIRWGEFCKVDDGQIGRSFFLLDLVDLLQQIGIYVLPPSKGKDGLYPPPAKQDGILLWQQDASVSNYSLEHIRKFIFDGLNGFDQANLKSMGMADFFDAGVRWYGPGGIGACLGFNAFERYHQGPWLAAFPDRKVQDLDALIAEGNYSAAPGWAGVRATHTGPYLGCGATGSTIEFNGLDWWKREGDKYVENWVFVDMVHLFRQFGIDLFERIPHTDDI